MTFSGTVWSLQLIHKENMYPDTIATVFLDDVGILTATEALKEDIHYQIYDHVDGHLPENPASILGYLNDKYNTNSVGLFVVRVFPPCSMNEQYGYYYEDTKE